MILVVMPFSSWGPAARGVVTEDRSVGNRSGWMQPALLAFLNHPGGFEYRLASMLGRCIGKAHSSGIPHCLLITGLLLLGQILQAPLLPFDEVGGNVVPLLLRNGLQMERTRRASSTPGTTAEAQLPVIDRLLIGGLIEGMRVKLAAPDALATGLTFLVVFDGAVVRSLCAVSFRSVRPPRRPAMPQKSPQQHPQQLQLPTNLRFLRSHGESVESSVNHGSHGFQFIPKLHRLLAGEHVFR